MATHSYTCVGFSAKIDWKTIEFLLPMPVYRICSVCGILPDMIFSLECGHVFCPTCMNELMLNSPVVACPFDKQAFEHERVSRDSSSQGYVSGCKSFCLNKAFGCNYIGPVSEMVEHYYSECSHHVVHCRSCKKPIARINVLAHLRSGCLTDVLASEMARTPAGPSAVGGGSDADNYLSTILSKIENLENVVLTRTNRLEDVLRVSRSSGTTSAVGNQVDTTANATADSRPDTTTVDTTTVDTTAQEEEHTDVESAASSSPSEDAATPVVNGDATAADTPSTSSRDQSPSEPPANTENGVSEQQAAESASDAAKAEPSATPQAFFTFDWEVKPFRKYRNAPMQVFTSQPLIVGENGYRVKLEGKFHDLGGPALFLGLYMRILKGPNDTSLQWPFNRKCSFVLLHSRHRYRDLTFSFSDEMNVEEMQNAANTSLKRPKQKENDSVGIDKCVPVAKMMQGGFVKGNVFKVRFVVE
ncbi:uncharacterized protein LOC144107875 [Amblyomma americanum]